MTRLLIVLMLITPVTVVAQTASIFGVVEDPSKAVIPGVQVTLEHLETGLKRTAVSGDSGAFVFQGVQPGKVRITVELPGFRKWVREMEIGSGGARITAVLEVASVATTVEVSVAQLPMVSSSAASVAIVTRSGTQSTAGTA